MVEFISIKYISKDYLNIKIFKIKIKYLFILCFNI